MPVAEAGGGRGFMTDTFPALTRTCLLANEMSKLLPALLLIDSGVRHHAPVGMNYSEMQVCERFGWRPAGAAINRHNPSGRSWKVFYAINKQQLSNSRLQKVAKLLSLLQPFGNCAVTGMLTSYTAG